MYLSLLTRCQQRIFATNAVEISTCLPHAEYAVNVTTGQDSLRRKNDAYNSYQSTAITVD